MTQGWIHEAAMMSDSVPTRAIQDDAVTAAKIDDDVITVDHLSSALKSYLFSVATIGAATIGYCKIGP